MTKEQGDRGKQTQKGVYSVVLYDSNQVQSHIYFIWVVSEPFPPHDVTVRSSWTEQKERRANFCCHVVIYSRQPPPD